MPIEKSTTCPRCSGPRGVRKRITFEYVLIMRSNDTNQDADELVSYYKMGALVNLLPLHPGGLGSHADTPARIRGVADRLRNQS